MKPIYYLVLLLTCFFVNNSIAQNNHPDTLISAPTKKYTKFLELRMENGAMLSNDTDLGDQLVNSSYYNGLDLRVGFKKTDPKDIYSNMYRRPTFGAGWYSATFHNNDVGKPHAMYFFLKMPFSFEKAKKMNFWYSGAFGLSYKFNPYDSIENPSNIFIGSYRNVYVHLEFGGTYKLSPHWALSASLGFKHFSNGSFKKPNTGINLIPFTLGVNYRFSEDEVELMKVSIPTFQKYGLLNIGFIAASKNYEVGEDNYFKGGLTINYLRQINYKYRLGGGVDIYYSPYPNLRNDSDASDFSKTFSMGITGSWEWALNRNLYVPLAIGVYLHRNEENNEIQPYYLRAGMRYRFSNQMFTGVTIKAHGGVADILEWTFGYTIGKDPNSYKN